MSLSVSEIMVLPGLEELTLRAGQSKIHRPVRWYYVAENEGIAEWVMGGELVFVTGINHPRDEANLQQLVREGYQCGIAGMVILTGEPFIHAIPDSVIMLANQLGIPLIEQPYLLKMVIVTQLIGTALVQRETLLRSQRDILVQLLTGDYPSIDIASLRANNLQLMLDRPHRVISLRLSGIQTLFATQTPAIAESRLQLIRQRVQQRLEEYLADVEGALPLIVLGDLYILLLPSNSVLFQPDKLWLQQVQQTLGTDIQPLMLLGGLSSVVASAHQYRRGLTEARQALDVAESMQPEKGWCDYNELGVLKLLTAVSEPALVTQFVKETLGMLFESNRKHPDLLIETLDAVLQENGNLIKAAERLAIHRNTLHQRLQRIEQRSGQSLNDPQFRLNASVALLVWRMSNAQQQELL
ncbi:PucR family transcriptional regulator ligand-binding domain-containing protein [Pectobacteriaceae bacterium CE90]|nr:PucR family transcriptional regulator [Prodigiosinella sp. LS101]WJV53153.1 PucR family transcriptional regulator ligand-binding domain-containing protein [Prodigiosinella sp. LS101]WJV57510.1 PucR family transcriptional regulator ligand-binding domain-containing protein [Pectobacteriaceae bacterium C111]WJY15820.1 PucR family transcriptional regulator ligand-binding domain-containing protein [Pectobacteriaceae bacterium CE90]